MKIAVFAALALLVQLLLYLCFGSLLMKMRKQRAWSLSGAVFLGFFAYFSVFEVVCFLCEITLASLDRLAVIMVVVSGAAILGGTISCFGDWVSRLKTLKTRVRQHGLLFPVMLLATASVCFFALIYTDASADSDAYVGMASTALFTNSIGRFDPTTGKLLAAINPRYAYALFPYHSAVLADLFRIPAMVASRTVMSVTAALMSCLSFYYLGLSLFRPASDCAEAVSRRGAENRRSGDHGRCGRDRKEREEGASAGEKDREREAVRRADVFTILLLCLYLFSATIYMPGTFLFSRTYEGKNLIANVVIPAVLAGCTVVYRRTDGKGSFLFADLFLVMLAGVCFSSSVMFAAMTLLAALVPCFLMRRNWKGLLGTLFSALPFFIWMALYILNSHRIFILTTIR